MKVNRRDFFVTTVVGAAGVAAYGTESPPITPPEALARYDWIIGKWGKNFTDEQKVDLMRLLTDSEKGLRTMRAFPLGNEVEPSR